jgi:hypothetical protein
MVLPIVWTLCGLINLIRVKRATKEVQSYGRQLDYGGITFACFLSVVLGPFMTTLVVLEAILDSAD